MGQRHVQMREIKKSKNTLPGYYGVTKHCRHISFKQKSFLDLYTSLFVDILPMYFY
jgi:hypothetical protein